METDERKTNDHKYLFNLLVVVLKKNQKFQLESYK